MPTAEKALTDAEHFVQAVEQAFGIRSVLLDQAPSADQAAKRQAVGQEGDSSLWDKSEGMEERRRQAVQNWLEYRKKQKEAARTASRDREQTRTAESGRDIGDEPDDSG